MDNQEARGNNILAVKQKMLNPEKVFSQIKNYSYEQIDPEKWYPMEQFTKLTDMIEKTFNPTVLKNIGRAIIPGMVKIGLLAKMPIVDFLKGLSHIYKTNNRGPNIGDWKILEEEAKHVILENSTLHNCDLEEGILFGAITEFGGKFARINQTRCKKKGDKVCIFDVAWQE